MALKKQQLFAKRIAVLIAGQGGLFLTARFSFAGSAIKGSLSSDAAKKGQAQLESWWLASLAAQLQQTKARRFGCLSKIGNATLQSSCQAQVLKTWIFSRYWQISTR